MIFISIEKERFRVQEGKKVVQMSKSKEAKRSATESAVLLGSNVLLAVAVIFSNKIVFTKLDFKFPIFLTLIHYVTIFIGIEACRRLGVYRQTPWKQLPLNQDMVLMVLLVAVGVALNNTSLRANAVGTYQLLKLLVTPGICICDYLLMGKTISRKRAYILLIVCFGVAVATVSDVELRAFGLCLGLVFVPVAAFYKVQWKKVLTATGANTMSLIHRVYPMAMPITALCGIFLDPSGITTFDYNMKSVSLLLISGLMALMISVSSFSIVAIFSPLTHQVLGLLKVSLSIIAGTIFFGNHVTNLQLFGATVALLGIGWYTVVTVEENKGKKRAKNHPAVYDDEEEALDRRGRDRLKDAV